MATGTITKVVPTSESGYCKMPDGTLIQWGQKNATFSNAVMVSGEITLPQTFIDNTAACFVSPQSTGVNSYVLRGGGNASGNKLYWVVASGAGDSLSVTRTFNYLAVGRWK